MNRSCNFSNVTNDYLAFYDCILSDMMDEMTHAELSDSISHNFITQMIPHHQGAVSMSENALRFPVCPQLIPILDAIIISQKEGIRQMQKLLDIASSPFDRDYIG